MESEAYDTEEQSLGSTGTVVDVHVVDDNTLTTHVDNGAL